MYILKLILTTVVAVQGVAGAVTVYFSYLASEEYIN
jgi:hypothetical protein